MEKSSDEPQKNDIETIGKNGEESPLEMEEDFNFVFDPHAKKMQQIHDQLEALIYKKRFARSRDY